MLPRKLFALSHSLSSNEIFAADAARFALRANRCPLPAAQLSAKWPVVFSAQLLYTQPTDGAAIRAAACPGLNHPEGTRGLNLQSRLKTGSERRTQPWRRPIQTACIVSALEGLRRS